MNMTISPELLDRIRNINWFSNCGNTVSTASDFKITYVKSWREAKTYYSDQNWENTTLDARNELTSFLSQNYQSDYQEWNNYTSKLRTSILPNLITKIDSFKKDYSLGDAFIHSVTWDILNAIMEDVYGEVADRPTFFLKLLEIYEAGNFPCGWIGKWPEGSLVVY